LRKRHPDFREEEVEGFVRKAEQARDWRRESASARLSGPMSEAHWFYEKGVRLRQEGRLDEANKVWQRLIEAFGDVTAERPWVARARTELSPTPRKRERTGAERWAPVRKALERANQLEKEGRAAEAERIRQGLKALYADDPSARPILEE